jgi:hypothetical protein
MNKKLKSDKKHTKYTPAQTRKEAERKRLIQEKRQMTINRKKRSDFIDYLYKKYGM